MTTIATALAHLDAAEARAHSGDDLLMAADIRYARTTLTLSTGSASATPVVAASDLTTHLESAAAALDQCVEQSPDLAPDLLSARAEIAALLQQGVA